MPHSAMPRLRSGFFGPSHDGPPHRYGIAIALVLAATVLRLVFMQALETRAAFIVFYPAVMLAAFYGGLRAECFATFLSAALADYFWKDARIYSGASRGLASLGHLCDYRHADIVDH